jgi:O-antigen ligase
MLMESPGARWSQRIVEVTILGFAFFSPWSIAGAQLCLGFGLISWAIKLIISRGRGLARTPLDLPILAFLGIELLSAMVSPHWQTGLRSLKHEWIVLIFFLVANNVRRRELVWRALDVLIAVTALVSLYAIWQHFAGWDLYRHRPLRPTGNVFEATGLFGHHLTYGGYVMVVLLVSGCLFLWGTRGRRKVALGLASLVLSLALICSYARSAWVGLLGGILAIGLLRGRKVLVLLLAGTVVLAGLVFLLQPSVRLQVQDAVNLLQDPVAKSSRIQMWLASLRMIRDHPLLGVGLGQVRQSLVAYGCDLGYAHPHNDLLNVMANAGFLGLAAFMWMWVAFLRMTVRCRSGQWGGKLSPALGTAGFGLLIAFLVAGLFQCYYTDAEDGMILWYLMGLTMAACRVEEKKGDRWAVS